ncbi:MAG: hypothetical protein Phog2KO_05130 [Phototrophicaceae bacterium]
MLSPKLSITIILIIFILTACGGSDQTQPLSGAIVPTRASTATATATLTPTATVTASPTLVPSSTPTLVPSPTATLPSIAVSDDFSFTSNGSITATDWQVRYTFNATMGDSISIEMTTDSPQLDPLLVILDASNMRLIANDDINETTDNAGILNYVVQADGMYTILATRRGEEDSPYIGDYQLNFLRLPANYYDPNTGISLMPIELNTDEIASITNDSPFQTFVITGNEGDVISIEMNRASGNLDAYLVIVNRQTQEILAENDDHDETSNAYLENITLPQTGEYIIIATRYQGVDGNSEGDFVLRISQP